MKFFSKNIFSKEHIDYILKYTKKMQYHKKINYSDNRLELIEFEKGVLVRDEEDVVYQQMKELTIYPFNFDLELENGQVRKNCNYIWEDVPKELKRYMQQKDNLFFNIKYKEFCKIRDNSAPPDYIIESRQERLDKYNDYNHIESSDEDDMRFLCLGATIPTTIEEKARNSARSRYKRINEIAHSNSHLFENFITLTFAPEEKKETHIKKNINRAADEKDLKFKYIDVYDYDVCVKAFTTFMAEFKRKLKKKYDIDLYYMCVPEENSKLSYNERLIEEFTEDKKHRIHFHLLTSYIPDEERYNVPAWLDMDYKEKKRYYGQGLVYWKYGKSDIQKIKSKRKIATYISKYILKSFQSFDVEEYQEFINRKKFFTSQNLMKPTKEYIDRENYREEFVNDENKKGLPYSVQYENPYNNSKISKTIYTNL